MREPGQNRIATPRQPHLADDSRQPATGNRIIMPSQSLSGALTTQSKRDPAGCTENDDRKTHGSHRATGLAQHASSLVAIRTVRLIAVAIVVADIVHGLGDRANLIGLALRADVVFLEVIGGYFTGDCVGIVVAIIQGVCPRRFRHGTPATTCSRGMACTGDSHHGDPAMERGTTMRGTLYVHSVMLPMLFNLHIHGGGTRQFGRLYPYIHGAAKIPWGGNLPMGRSVKFYLPQNKAIFNHRPMRNSPPHGPITTP